VVSIAAIGLLAVVGWFTLPALTGSRAAKVKAPIVLPPRVATVPPKKDSVAERPDSQGNLPGPVVDPAASSATDVKPGPSSRIVPGRGRSAAPIRSADSRSTRTDTTIVRSAQAAPLAQAPRSESPSARIDYEGQATALFNAGDLVGARDRFLLATRFAPTARAWTNYGVTLQRLGDVTGAGAAYQSAIGMDANYLEAWLYQGRLAVELGEVARAVPLFQRARSINPRHSEVNVELARLESEAQNWSETRRFSEDAVRADPSNARAHWYLAIASDQLKDFEVAAREYAAYLQTVGAAERDQARFVGYARQRLTDLKGKP
jgi:Flp pilus assembly protein TadD